MYAGPYSGAGQEGRPPRRRILIVDDHEIVRAGIRSLLSSSRPDWEICGEATSGAEAIDAASRLKPEVVILDITMPGMSGLEAAPRIAELGFGSRVLVFTMHESRMLTNDIKNAGAMGYVLKSRAAKDLVTAIDRILAGETFFAPPESENGGAGTAS